MSSIRIITPPVQVVTAAEAKAARVFMADDADSFVDLRLAAAQSQIDGPMGWLKRSVGEQVLELALDGFFHPGHCSIDLPLPPIVEVVSIKYRDDAGAEQTIDSASYEIVGDEVRPVDGRWTDLLGIRPGAGPFITYKAGWKADNAPAAIKHAIMLMAAELRTIGPAGGIVRREQVEGIGTFDYAVPDVVAKQLSTTAERLLSGFRIYRV